MKKVNVILTAVLCAVFIMALYTAAFASENGPFTLQLGYSDFFYGRLIVDDFALTLTDVPESEEYNYVMLSLINDKGNEVYKSVVQRNDDDTAVFSLKYLEKKQYRMQIAHGLTEDTTELHDIFDVLYLSWVKGWMIGPSPAYDKNMKRKSADLLSDEEFEFHLRPEPSIESENDRIIETADRITRNCSSDYMKALAVHDWVAGNLYYDYDIAFERYEVPVQSALTVLDSRRCDCEGFVNLTAALLRASGIPTKIVSGYVVEASGGEKFNDRILNDDYTNHVWNEAYADGRWITIDATWDCGNIMDHGIITSSKGCTSHRYFDISDELFAYDHLLIHNPVFHKMVLQINNPMITVDGSRKISIDESGTKPLIINATTLIPIRSIIEEMGGTVEWRRDGAYNKVTLNVNDHIVQMWIGYKKYYVDGVEQTFSVRPQIINERTMIPLRGVLEGIGCNIDWKSLEGGGGMITISYINQT